MTVIINIEDMPKFIKIIYIFFKLGCDIPYLVGTNFETINHDEHLQAYVVQSCPDITCISFDELPTENSCVLHSKTNDCKYITCNF